MTESIAKKIIFKDGEEEKISSWCGSGSIGLNIMARKYLNSKETDDSIMVTETLDEWFDRVSGGNKEIKKLIVDKKFLFGGRILSNRGINNKGVTYSNCYVLSVEDSIESIYNTCASMARTYSYGGGVGIDISPLRPNGAVVNNSAKTTTGAVSFMDTFDEVTGTIGQHGRRGALMLSMDVRHPDINEFINKKANIDHVTNANISVMMHDDFMKSVEKDNDYYLRWPINYDFSEEYKSNNVEYDKLYSIKDEQGKIKCYYKKIKAKPLFDKLSELNWDWGEPGILYWDTIQKWNMMSADTQFSYAGVNPCAEEPLPNGGACLLGSMNLYAYVSNEGTFQWDMFNKDVHICTKALNEILDEGSMLHPLKIQRDTVDKYKQIGLGLFGLSDALIKMKIRYGSDESYNFADKVTHNMLIESFKASCDLNIEGIKYKNLLDSELYKERIEPFLNEKYKSKYPRNSQLLTIAPTGTLSTLLGKSGGAEPLFRLHFIRRTKSIGENSYNVYAQAVLDFLGKTNEELNGQSIDMTTIPDYIVSSDELDWSQRVKMQAVLQKNIDASISSTVNLPKKATIDTVHDIYMNAWKEGLKGITIFRDGCKRSPILSDTEEDLAAFNTTKAPHRPKVLEADYYQIKAKGDTFRIFVGLYNGKPYELFALPYDGDENIISHKGKITKISKRVYKFESELLTIDNIAIEEPKPLDLMEEIEKISNIVNVNHTLTKDDVISVKNGVYNIKKAVEDDDEVYRNVSLHVSAALRHGMPIKSIISLESKCNDSIVSFNRAVSRILTKYIDDNDINILYSNEKCPECGATLKHKGGCIECPSCGYSHCG